MKALDNSPTAHDVIATRHTIDGEDRHDFFAPELAKARKEWAKLTFLVSDATTSTCNSLTNLQTFGMISIFMFLFLSIYFGVSISAQTGLLQLKPYISGSYYAQIGRATHFSIEVIDLDSVASPSGSAAHPAILGPAIRTAILQSETTYPHLGWYEADSATLQEFRLTATGQGTDPYQYGVKSVSNQDVWGVMIINANATSGVWSALTSGSMWDRESARLLRSLSS